MAGIGLTLRRLVADQTFLGAAAAYFSSGVISAGPWLISVISLAILQGTIANFLNSYDRQLLFVTITYAFVCSLIITGPIQIVLTRVVADHIFLREFNAIAPTFTRTLILSVALLVLIILPFLAWAPFDVPYRLLAASLFVTVALLWLGLSTISAAQDYVSLMLSFLIGYIFSGGAAVVSGRLFGLVGALAGFTFGQVVCLALLINRIYLEFPAGGKLENQKVTYWAEYWNLALVGCFYYLGQWAEKLFYWFSPIGIAVQGFYRTFPPYDSSILLAYLMTIPASAVIMVNLETDFYLHYRAFFAQVLRKGKSDHRRSSQGTLSEITRARLAMIRAARGGMLTLLKLQGLAVFFTILIAPDLAHLIGLDVNNLTTLRVAILAASGQAFVLYVVLLLLYLDARSQTLLLTLVFAGSNLTLTTLAYLLVPGIYGLGYLFSTILTALLGMYFLNSRLTKLDYITFMLQPLEAKRPRGTLTEPPSSKDKVTA